MIAAGGAFSNLAFCAEQEQGKSYHALLQAAAPAGNETPAAPPQTDRGTELSPETYAAPVCAQFAPLQSHRALTEQLAVIRNGALQDLFYCGLPGMGGKIRPERYLQLLRTTPAGFDWSRFNTSGIVTVTSQYWDVRWAYGFDSQKAYARLLAWNPPAAAAVSVLEPLALIKKEFPKQEAGRLAGYTSFGYNSARANANTTPNYILPGLMNDSRARRLPVLMMSYAEPPWYLKTLSIGFLDFFRFLTEDIVIAQGSNAGYDSENPAFPQFKLVPPQLQFWMERKNETRRINLNEETFYLSVPMLKSLWDNAPRQPLSADELAGDWDADLIMNAVMDRAQARLSLTPGGTGELQSRFSGGVQTERIVSAAVRRDGALVLQLADGEPPLMLKRVQPGVPVFAGRRCIPVNGAYQADGLGKWVDFLPWQARRLFFPQYLISEEGKRSYCLHYLIRKSAGNL